MWLHSGYFIPLTWNKTSHLILFFCLNVYHTSTNLHTGFKRPSQNFSDKLIYLFCFFFQYRKTSIIGLGVFCWVQVSMCPEDSASIYLCNFENKPGPFQPRFWPTCLVSVYIKWLSRFWPFAIHCLSLKTEGNNDVFCAANKIILFPSCHHLCHQRWKNDLMSSVRWSGFSPFFCGAAD